MNNRMQALRIISGLIFLSLLFSPAASIPAQAGQLSDKPDPTNPKKKPRAMTQRPGLALEVAQSTSGHDAFGYTWDDTGAYSWVDPNTPGWTQANFNDRDEGVTGPISLGFNFKYYENSYNQVYLSTNGLLTFGEASPASSNELIPFIGSPNNFIAPFWADLYVGPVPSDSPIYTGTVSYQSLPGQFVVAYQNVTRFGALPSDFLTFEIVLFNGGKICFNYNALNTNLDYTTVGIEDADGVDGLQYFYNNQGSNVKNLVGAHSLCFNRPLPRRAVKLLPHYSSSLTVQGKAEFEVKLRNIGEAGDDKFDLTYQKSNPSWTVGLYDETGTRLLVDTSQNGIPDTGAELIQFGSYFTTTVKISAPPAALIGSGVTITLTATSVNCPSCNQSMRIQAAVPAPFAQSLVNNDSGIELDLVWAPTFHKTHISKDFTGSVLAITGKPSDNYTIVWEDNEDKIVGFPPRQVSYTSLDIAKINRYGALLHEQTYLTDNEAGSTPQWQINDKSPAVAVAPNGRVGVVWVREIISNTALLPTDKRNYNIYFTALEAGSSQTPMFAPIDVTGNTTWRGGADIYNSPYFISPRIAATTDGRFFLSWSDERTLVSGQQGNVLMAVYDTAGSLVSGVQQITQGTPGGDTYKDPSLASLSGARLLLSYAHLDTKSNPISIDYEVFNSSATPLTSKLQLGPAVGYLPTASQLGSGNILLAWTGSEGQINYAMLDGSSYQRVKGPLQLPSPDGLLGDYASITLDSQGKAIITWSDTDFFQQLYYAFLDQNGNMITPPLGFNQVGGSTYLIINDGGNGLAPYTGSYQTVMPVIRRQ